MSRFTGMTRYEQTQGDKDLDVRRQVVQELTGAAIGTVSTMYFSSVYGSATAVSNDFASTFHKVLFVNSSIATLHSYLLASVKGVIFSI